MFKLITQHVKQITQNVIRRQIATTSVVFSNQTTTADQLIDVTKALEGWDNKLKEAGVGDIDFNLKCLVAHVLKRKFVSL